MSGYLEDTVPPYRIGRIPTRFERWAWSPIQAYRMGLTLSYIGSLYFGISAFIAGVPAFVITAPEGWTPIWAAVLIVGSIIACIGSISDSKASRGLELVGSWAIFLALATYAAILLIIAYGSGDASRAAVGAGFVALGIQPAVRMLWLMSQVGRKTL